MSRAGTLTAIAAATALQGAAALMMPWQEASAQQIYRSVGPDGKVTFSDQPPANNASAGSPSAGKGKGSAAASTAADDAGNSQGTAAAGGGSALPYALQQIANRFPVTLYTSADCAPCASARNLLLTRGIPFTERTVDNNESIDALKAISGGNTVPFGTIGGQHLNGFADSQWTQYLDVAGYPKQSQLPGNYRRPAATPLATAKEATPVPARPAAAPPVPVAPAPAPVAPLGPTPSNPTGIVF